MNILQPNKWHMKNRLAGGDWISLKIFSAALNRLQLNGQKNRNGSKPADVARLNRYVINHDVMLACS